MIGIDLGTTNSAVGVIEAGFPIVLADAENRRLLPSAVSFAEDTAIVGHEAKDPVTSIKSLIGRSKVPESYHGAITKTENGQIYVQSGEKWLTPVEVSAEILKTLKSTAEMRLDSPQTEAVISVPAYAYGLERASERTKIAVYDLGGGTFDISILEMREGNFEVLATAGDTELGGDDFDSILADKLNCSISEAITAKFAFDDADEVQGLTAAEYEKSCWQLLDRSRRCCERAIIDAGISKTDLEKVILVGGSTKMPIVQRHVESVFEQKPDLCMNPDEAVVLGAGIQAGLLSGSIQTLSLLDVTPLSLGIETFGGLMNILIPRNSTIPCKKGEMFTNAVDGQTSMKINILQGEREFAKDNWSLGELEVPFTTAAKGQARVGIQFSLDEDGILSALDEALTLCGDALDHETLTSINAAKSDVLTALETNDGKTLKSAVARLDDATEELASLVMQSLLG